MNLHATATQAGYMHQLVAAISLSHIHMGEYTYVASCYYHTYGACLNHTNLPLLQVEVLVWVRGEEGGGACVLTSWLGQPVLLPCWSKGVVGGGGWRIVQTLCPHSLCLADHYQLEGVGQGGLVMWDRNLVVPPLSEEERGRNLHPRWLQTCCLRCCPGPGRCDTVRSLLPRCLPSRELCRAFGWSPCVLACPST